MKGPKIPQLQEKSDVKILVYNAIRVCSVQSDSRTLRSSNNGDFDNENFMEFSNMAGLTDTTFMVKFFR